MGWEKVIVLVMILQLANINTLLPQRVVVAAAAAEADILSPLLAPVMNEICSHVDCGKGKCEASTNDTLGFICNCNSGWSQYWVEDELRFLPCVIPNCSINYSCSNISTAPAPSPLPPLSNFSILDPCLGAYCGGGQCVNGSTIFDYKCECDEGFYNLFNSTSFPCYRECSLGARCVDLGITLPNSTYTSPPAPSSFYLSSKSSRRDPNNLLGIFIMMLVIMIRAI